VGQTPPTILTAMTYNVLAQSLIDKNMHLYRNTEALCWESRRQLLLRELREARADIVCLQEVEDEHYHNWFLPNMSSLGYGGLYKKRTGEHTDGCAVFYNSSQLKLLDWRPVEFQKRVKVLDRDNVGLVAKFEIPVSGQRSAAFCLATTHLLFNPKAGEVKLAQMVCLLAELDRLATPPSGKPRLACIMCGDLNSLPSSPLLRFLENGLLAISGLKRDQVAGYHFRDSSQRESIPVPLLPPEVPISQECRLLSASDDNPARPGIDSHLFHGTIFLSAYFSPSPSRHRSSRRPASGDGSSNHPSSDATATSAQPSPPAQSFTGVHSARPTSVGSPKSVTTYHMKAIEMVDYIHYTPTTFLTTPSNRRSPFNQEDYRQPGFCLLGRRSLISPGSLRKMGPQPHSLLPSDHLWLLARLQFFPGPPHTH
jgi:protein angel